MVLAFLFFMTALLYACIGFGGGSTYNALLVLGDTDYQLIPIISLICNIVVVSGGVWHFSREGHIRLSRIAPWIVFSVPASFVGGLIPVPEVIFTGVLGFALLLSGIRLLWPEKEDPSFPNLKAPQHSFMPAIFGTLLGLMAGITGIQAVAFFWHLSSILCAGGMPSRSPEHARFLFWSIHWQALSVRASKLRILLYSRLFPLTGFCCPRFWSAGRSDPGWVQCKLTCPWSRR